MLLAATISTHSKALWYATRGFGLVSLVLLSLTMVLGLTQVGRLTMPGWPRFVLSALHKNASLVAVSVLGVHILTAVLDSYAPIQLVDIFIPFVSEYRPIWLGLGAIAVDLLIALIVTSLLRKRLGHRTWRAIHWAAYACWPVALIHGLGTGSDTKLGWVLLLNAACIAAVLASLWWRLAKGLSAANLLRRGSAFAASVVLPLIAGVWTVTGPLHSGWARRAGTPLALIGSQATASTSPNSSSSPGPAAGGAPATLGGLNLPLTARFGGTQTQTRPDGSGLVSIIITGTFRHPQAGRLRLVLTGPPAGGGGVDLTGSQVDVGTSSDPGQFSGHVTTLEGTTVLAAVSDASGASYTVTIRLGLGSGGVVDGTIEVGS